MNIAKLIELNERVLEKAIGEVEKALITGKWDQEDMEALSMAIKNIHKLEGGMMHEYKEYKEEPKEYGRKAKEGESEFMSCLYEVMEKHPGQKGIDAVIMLFDEHMDDLRVIHPKMYDNIMVRLKGMK